jgi:hypothetical protein
MNRIFAEHISSQTLSEPPLWYWSLSATSRDGRRRSSARCRMCRAGQSAAFHAMVFAQISDMFDLRGAPGLAGPDLSGPPPSPRKNVLTGRTRATTRRRNSRTTFKKVRPMPLSSNAFAKVCWNVRMIETVLCQGYKNGKIKTGNAHSHTITSITNHVQRTPLINPAQVTISPIAITAREAKPVGEKQLCKIMSVPFARKPLSFTVTAASNIVGASIRSASVKKTLETARAS